MLLCNLFTAGCDVVEDMVDKSSANALWRIVSSCANNERHDHTPVPCEQVNLTQGYAVLKDIKGKTQFLLIPTSRISGIESPELLKAGAPNYWLPAWEMRADVFKRAGKPLPEKDIGMAINSPYGRTQNQLHIHIDCLKPEVITTLGTTLEANKKRRNGRWFKIDFPQPLHSYQALYVHSLKADPFKLLAENVKDMSRETLAVARVDKGFVLLADTADLKQGDRASSEEILDHECKAANER